MLQEFVEIVVHMAMIFLALSMLDKLESFFQDLVSVSSVRINPSLTLPITNQSKSSIFNFSFKKYFLNASYMPGTVLGTEDLAVNKRKTINFLSSGER